MKHILKPRLTSFMKKSFIITVLFLVIPAVGIGVSEGEISDLGEISLTPYGMIKGRIIFELGNLSWYPEEIWILPEGMETSSFKSTGETLKLSSSGSDIIGSNCETRIYESNQSIAFKITSSKISEGNFCALVHGGEYEIKAK